MRHVGVLMLMMTVCLASRARAQEGAITLTLPAAIARAVERSPLVQRARGERRVVESLRVGAGAVLPTNPFLSFAAGKRWDNSGSAPAAQGFEWGLHLEQSLEIGGQRGTRLSEVDRAVAAAAARERFSRVEVRALVRATYIGALLFHSHVDAAKRREALATRVLDSARQRVASGA